MRRVVIVALASASLGACDRGSNEGPSRRGQARVVGDLVARVGDLPIGASELRTLMETEGRGADSALQQLVSEALLLQEAERIGLTEDRESERAVERLMVRAMLHDLEKQNTPESISDAEVRADYACRADELQGREARTVDQAQDEIRTRLSQQKRLRAVVEIIRALEARGLVRYDERGVERLLSMSGLPEPPD